MCSDFFRLFTIVFHYSNALSLCSHKDKEHPAEEIAQIVYNETTTYNNRSRYASRVCRDIKK